MKYFNRLAHREFLVLVAIVASALTMHVRQHVDGPREQAGQTVRVNDGRICEPPAADAKQPRMLPADCGIRAKMPAARARTLWV